LAAVKGRKDLAYQNILNREKTRQKHESTRKKTAPNRYKGSKDAGGEEIEDIQSSEGKMRIATVGSFSKQKRGKEKKGLQCRSQSGGGECKTKFGTKIDIAKGEGRRTQTDWQRGYLL